MTQDMRIAIIGNGENEKKFYRLTSSERLELIRETMNGITNILVYSGIPAEDFPGVLRAHAEILEDKFTTLKSRGTQ